METKLNHNEEQLSETAQLLDRSDFPAILTALAEDGYEIIAPVRRDGAIIYDTIDSIEDLPAGWSDTQSAGAYRLERRNDKALFGYAVGPHSWKKYLHPPERVLWRASKQNGALAIEKEPEDTTKRAFLGVRACEIAAIDIQNQVFVNGPYKGGDYESRRKNTLLIAVNCAAPAETCFCASMNTGPEVKTGFDIVLTELVTPQSHEFLIKSGSALGAKIMERLPLRKAAPKHEAAASTVTEKARQSITRKLDTQDLQELLQDNPNHPQWDDVASRCLSCTNCTAVCPTCFCTTVEDHTDLAGKSAERIQRWDSCFSGAFSELSGGPVRQSTKSRYRQWMTHKLSTWIDQFGTSGCVGCGRCIAWCPVGIDITAEAAAIRGDSEEEMS
ncbi:MAG: 4Fe-4S dicluster domain-containing protein [Pseudomonadota bacterium]